MELENKEAQVEQKAEESVDKEKPGFEEYMKDIPGAPTKDQIETWKQQFGDVLCSAFSETEIFIWRPVTRAEFVGLQAAMAQQEVTQFDFEDKLVETCALWVSPLGEESLQTKAGSLSTLQEQIMQNSNFMNSAVAASLVIKL